MKPESYAWRQLGDRAAAQLRSGFADDVLRATHGPEPEVWRQMEAQAAGALRPGFADRVVRAVRAALPAQMPSLFSQLALSAATAAVCMLAVVYLHDRTTRLQDERSLADWQRLAADAQDLDQLP
jgi:hypothetical protein